MGGPDLGRTTMSGSLGRIEQGAEVRPRALVRDQRIEVRELRDVAAVDEQEASAHLAQDLEVERLVRVHAQEDDVAFVAQPPEEIQHEADVAVLDRELRLVEEMDEGPRASC